MDPDPPVVVGRHLPRGDGVGPAAGEVFGAEAVAEDDQIVAVSSRACLKKVEKTLNDLTNHKI